MVQGHRASCPSVRTLSQVSLTVARCGTRTNAVKLDNQSRQECIGDTPQRNARVWPINPIICGCDATVQISLVRLPDSRTPYLWACLRMYFLGI
jgi:hypothetical protein